MIVQTGSFAELGVSQILYQYKLWVQVTDYSTELQYCRARDDLWYRVSNIVIRVRHPVKESLYDH